MTWDKNDYLAAGFLLTILLFSLMLTYFMLSGGSGGFLPFI